MENWMKLVFDARSRNEAFARLCAAGFAAQLDLTITDINDIKTAVSEAVTNAIIHGYQGKGGQVVMEGSYDRHRIVFRIQDDGVGIPDIEQARQPLYTSRPDLERSGMGFTVMETFMDAVEVSSAKGRGTTVTLTKNLTAGQGNRDAS
jgi:stage II sporulation protein AB (anti-sigma F factor)